MMVTRDPAARVTPASVITATTVNPRLLRNIRADCPRAKVMLSSEHIAQAYEASFGLPVLVTRGSNTYGPYQYPEKVIPLFVTRILFELTAGPSRAAIRPRT